MSHKHSTKQESKWLYSSESLQCVSLDGETIFYSETKKEYFGVSGIATEILTISQKFPTGFRLDELIDEIAVGRELGGDDRQLILDGIATLIDLGALHE